MEKKMDKTFLLDANILVASLNPNDSLHQPVLKFLKSIDTEKKIVNSFILSEIASILLIRTKNLALAKNFIKKLTSKQINQLQHQLINQKIFEQTIEIFAQQQKNKLSFADCSLIAHAQTKQITNIVTLDKDLRKEFKNQFSFWPKKLS